MGITRTNGTQERLDTPKPFDEIGSTGLPSYSGYITKAYLPALQWPTCEPAYSKIWRSDPETIMAWQMFSALAGKVNLTWELPEQIGNRELPPPNDADKRALDFCWSVTAELDGGLNGWLSDEVTHTPFYGWRLWSTPMGKRSTGWKPPNPTDPWRSKENDGLIGIRRFMSLDYSTFGKWILDKQTGRVLGWEQNDLYNGSGTVKIPIDYLIHTRYGDMSNPEGIAVLEGMYWLEYAQRQLEKIQAIGYERTAGYLAFEADRPLTTQDDPYIRNAARAVLAAQEANYLALPQGLKANIIDTPFSAATTLLEVIRYYSVRKLALLGVQFIAMSTMSGTGSYAALDDSSSMAILMFNSIVQGSVRQLSEQLTDKLFKWNAAAFPGMSRTPGLHAAPIDKAIGLTELATFAQAIKDVMPLGDDDFIAIRKKSEFLPEALPEVEEVATPEPVATEETPEDETMPDEGSGESDMMRPFELAGPAQTGNDDIDPQLKRYYDDLNTLSNQALNGEIDQRTFEERAEEIVIAVMLLAFILGGGNPESPGAGATLAKQRGIALQSVKDLSGDLYAGDLANKPQRGKLSARLNAAANFSPFGWDCSL